MHVWKKIEKNETRVVCASLPTGKKEKLVVEVLPVWRQGEHEQQALSFRIEDFDSLRDKGLTKTRFIGSK